MSVFKELKRRNVFRVAAAYLVAGWLMIEVSETLEGTLHLPDWADTLLAYFLILGFPIVLFFSWAYEITPEGIKREKDIAPDDFSRARTARRLDWAVIFLFVLAAGFFIFDRFVPGEDEAAPITEPVLVEQKTFTADGEPQAETSIDEKSIAVLPFVNMSNDPSNVYFSDGMSEELLNLLAKVSGLKVIGRTSSFQFKGKNEDLRVIGEKLGVAHILEGSVRKSGDTVRVTAQLISADDGAHLWSDSFDRNLDDVFKVQDEIARSVVETLRVKLLGNEVSQRATPKDSEAYDLFLKGRYFIRKLDNEKAKDYFEQALALDPELALAWDGLGSVYVNQILNGVLPPKSGQRLAMDTLFRALELDPTMSSSHYRIGFMRMIFNWDFPGAEAAFRRALEIEPNSAQVLSGLGLLSMAMGRSQEAIDFQRRSLEADPLRSASHHNLGFIAYQSQQYELAESSFRKVLEMAESSYPRGNYYLSLALLLQGRLEEAYSQIQIETADQFKLAGIAVIAHALDRDDESDAALLELEQRFGNNAAVMIAEAHAYRGEVDEAFAWLDRAIDQHDPLIPWVRDAPLLESLKTDPRFEQLLQRVHARAE